MMKLTQAQKAAKTNIFPDYWTLLYGRRLSDIMIKTLTGTLPLTFRTSETALRSWTIYGNNTPHNYSATGTLPLTFTTHTAGAASDWSITGNDVGQQTVNLYNPNAKDVNNGYVNPGRLRPDGTISTTQTDIWVTEFIPVTPNVVYTLCDVVQTSNYGLCFYDSQKNYISGQTYSVEDHGNVSFTTPTATTFLRFTVKSGYQTMLVAGSTAPQTYVPYGYEIPISVNGTPQTFYIGDSPLTAGQSISKTSTGVDIAAVAGTNTITTDLYNKPEMAIEGVDYVGVGEYVNDSWQIPLTVTHYTDNIFDKDAKNANKGYEDSTCIMWAGSIPYPYMTGNIPEDNNCFVSEKIPASPNTTYYLTDGIFKNTDNGIYSVFLWNRFRMSDYQAFPTEKTFTTGDDTKFIQLCVLKSYADTVMITTKPTETYIPHVEVNNVNVPIDAPLTEGESITDTVTISTFEGENTIDTTMTNKPDMSITYKGDDEYE